ncbi:MAG: MFS transporter [Gammaproteobacteria bacterium]|nr:MFS transporter [Gammaproteobacteria bacterium]
MLDRLSKRKRNIGLLVVLALIGWFFWTIRAVLNPLILGYLLAFVLHPVRMEQVMLARMVADAAPEHLRGAAFGAFNAVSGIMVLSANVLVGALWTVFGPEVAFLSGAAIAGVTLLGTLVSVAFRSRASASSTRH